MKAKSLTPRDILLLCYENKNYLIPLHVNIIEVDKYSLVEELIIVRKKLSFTA